MPKNLTRQQVVDRLEGIKRYVNREINFLLADLREDAEAGGRPLRDYDMPTPDAEEIAAKWGVDLAPDPEETIPEWVQAKIAKHLPENQ